MKKYIVFFVVFLIIIFIGAVFIYRSGGWIDKPERPLPSLIYGQVTEKTENKIKILSKNNNLDYNDKEFEFLLSSNVVVILIDKNNKKTVSEFESELYEYEHQKKEDSKVDMPIWFKEVKINISDISIGDYISLYYSINNTDKLVAEKIIKTVDLKKEQLREDAYYKIIGNILSINDKLIIKQANFINNGNEMEPIEIILDNKTNYFIKSKKDENSFKEEFSYYRDKLGTSDEAAIPQRYIVSPATKTDFSLNDKVEIEMIGKNGVFVASKVFLRDY